MPSPVSIRKHFPILQRRFNQKPLVYIDNASTTQKPTSVIESTRSYYLKSNANVHRGIYALSEEASALYEHSRVRVAKFIGSTPEEIIFTKGTTESINGVARSWGDAHVGRGDRILVTQMEHHANLVPWQQLAKRAGAQLSILPITDDGRWDLKQLPRFLSERTKIVAVNHCSNVLGTINPVATLIRAAKQVGAITVIDGAQSIAHINVDMRSLDCDFYAFSGHKMYGPTGVGVLYGKRSRLEEMEPWFYGGDMVTSVDWFDAQWNDIPYKFEGGTPNIEGVVGLGAAIQWIEKIGWDTIEKTERALTQELMDMLHSVAGLTIHGPQDTNDRIGVVSFTLKGTHPHDIASILDERAIAIRAGHHCAMPLMTRLGVAATARASLAMYNTKTEIQLLGKALEHVNSIFQPKTSVVLNGKNLWQKNETRN